MARVRSPNYPALSLPEAIHSVAKVFDKENRHRASKEVVVKAMGYGGVNGASLGSLSALSKYGLLERDGEDYRVSDRAMAILHPRGPGEKAGAISEAACDPALFAEMLGDFPGSIPSDDNLRSYLVRRGFSPTALSGVIKAFRETMELVGTQGEGYVLGPQIEEPPMHVSAPTNTARGPSAPASQPVAGPAGADPYRVSFTPSGGLEVVGRLNKASDVDDLVRALNVWKVLFKPVSEIKEPGGYVEGNGTATGHED